MSKPSSHVTSNPRENVEESEEATMVIWLCDYCKEARYDTFDECQIHEEQECPKNVVRVLAAAGRSSSSDKDEEEIDEEARVRAELQESEVEGKSNEHGDDSINQNTTEEDPTTAANNEKPAAKESDQNKIAKERGPTLRQRSSNTAWKCHKCSRHNALSLLICPECGEYKAKSMFSTPDSTEGCEIVQGVERNDDECHVCRLEGGTSSTYTCNTTMTLTSRRLTFCHFSRQSSKPKTLRMSFAVILVIRCITSLAYNAVTTLM
jgi:hypothetical protein